MSNKDFLQAIRLPEVENRTGLKRSQIYKLQREGKFPQNVKLGMRASAWLSNEIDEWLTKHAQARYISNHK